MKKALMYTLTGAAMLGLATVSHAGMKSIAETAQEAGSFTTLLTAVEAAGLAPTLSGEGAFTVFAPTDEAFAKLPEGAIAGLLENPDALKTVLLHHVVAGKMPASDVVSSETITTLSKQALPITAAGGPKIGDASIVQTDIMCSNGVIHVIDEVLLPKDIVGVAAANKSFSTLVAAVKAAGLLDTLTGEGPFTVFAPSNDAFEKLPAGTVQSLLLPQNKQKLVDILTYHVVPGHVTADEVVGMTSAASAQGSAIPIRTEKDGEGNITGVLVQDARVVETDVLTANGIIHVIDTVIIPQ